MYLPISLKEVSIWEHQFEILDTYLLLIDQLKEMKKY